MTFATGLTLSGKIALKDRRYGSFEKPRHLVEQEKELKKQRKLLQLKRLELNQKSQELSGEESIGGLIDNLSKIIKI